MKKNTDIHDNLPALIAELAELHERAREISDHIGREAQSLAAVHMRMTTAIIAS
jgi:uncharacterized coiled-coil DUF342 family protein